MSSTAYASRGRARMSWPATVALAVAVVSCGAPDPLARVEALQQEGRFAESIEPLRELLAEGGDDPEIHYLYGLALSNSAQKSEAMWPLRKAMRSPEFTVPAGLQLAHDSFQTGNIDTAIEVIDRVLEVEPEHTGALVLRAFAKAHSRRDYAGTLEDAERALEIDPDYFDALVPRVVALLALDRIDEAGEALEELEHRYLEVTLDSAGSARYCAARASFAKEKGDAESAGRIYGECLEAYPSSLVLIESATEFFDATGDFERAADVLRGALDELPAARVYRIALAGRLEAMGDAEGAEAVLRDGTEVEHPALAADAWADLAGFYIERDEFDDGIAAFERAVESAPERSPKLLFSYADALVVAGRYDEALAVADEITVPAHREAVRGRAHLERGEPALALERFSEGARLWPDNAVARYLTALAAERVGDIDRAIEEYRYAVRSGPDATDALLRLARLHAAEGEFDLAVTALRHGEPDLPMALLELLNVARQRGDIGVIPPRLVRLVAPPAAWPRAVAATAGGIRIRDGSAASAAFIRAADRLDLTDPQNAPALRALVADLGAAGDAAGALSLADASVEAHPEVAAFHAIRGLALANHGAPPEKVREAFERAVEIDPGEPRALLALARASAQSGRVEAALSLYDRAAAADPESPDPGIAAAELLISADRAEEAERRLAEMLVEHPYDPVVARMLAERRLARGESGPETLALARRAVRFGGGDAARALLDRAG